MTRKVAGAVVVAIAALAGSACGTSSVSDAIALKGPHYVVQIRQVVRRLPLSRSGVGSELLGTFAVHGVVRMRATCVGRGTIEVDFSAGPHAGVAMSGEQCQGDNTLAMNASNNPGVMGRPLQITVRVPPRTKWWIVIADRQRG
jgi:hypothetical protein